MPSDNIAVSPMPQAKSAFRQDATQNSCTVVNRLNNIFFRSFGRSSNSSWIGEDASPGQRDTADDNGESLEGTYRRRDAATKRDRPAKHWPQADSRTSGQAKRFHGLSVDARLCVGVGGCVDVAAVHESVVSTTRQTGLMSHC